MRHTAHLHPQVGNLLQDPDGAVRQAAPLVAAQRITNHPLAARAGAAVGPLQLALQSLAGAAGQCQQTVLRATWVMVICLSVNLDCSNAVESLACAAGQQKLWTPLYA